MHGVGLAYDFQVSLLGTGVLGTSVATSDTRLGFDSGNGLLHD